MTESSELKEADLLDATACLYKLGTDKACHRWSFMLKRERGTTYDCLWFLEDLLPFHFTESGIENTTVVSQGTLKYSIPCEDVEEGTVRVEEEWHEKTMLLALDEGDTTTTTERALIAQEGDEDVSGTDGMPTRKSTRSRKQAKDNNFVFVLIFMSWSKTF